MKCALIGLIVSLNLISFGQILPGFRNGSWWIINNGKQIDLPKSYTYLGNFDKNGTASFIENNKYGIINATGEVIVKPSYSNIVVRNYGVLECTDSTGTFLWESKSSAKILESINESYELNEYYLLVRHHDSLANLVHLPSLKTHTYADTFMILNSRFNTITLRPSVSDSTFYFYDQDGLKSILKNDEFLVDDGVILITKNEEYRVITANISLILRNNPFAWAENEMLSYYDGKQSHLINTRTQEEIATSAYHQIIPEFNGGFYVRQNGKMGFMDEAMMLRIPLNYESITRNDDGFDVMRNNLVGFIDKDYRQLIPVQYDRFYQVDDWFYTFGRNQERGLFSLKTKRAVLDAIYDEIIFVNDNTIKAYRGDAVRIVEITDNHRIVSDLILPNAVTVRQDKFSELNPEYKFDRRLLRQGWFYIQEEQMNPTTGDVKTSYRWGLRNQDDSVLINPRYSIPKYIANQEFSLLSMGNRKVANKFGYELSLPVFSMRSFITGKNLNNEIVLAIDSFDCKTRSFFRFESLKGNSIYFSNDSIVIYPYVSSSHEKYFPVCKSGMAQFCESKDGSVPTFQRVFDSKQLEQQYRLMRDWQKVSHREFIDAKWNYLDTNGADLFDFDFDFADDFYNDRAKVKLNGQWGLVCKDSILIPMAYSSVKEIKLKADTVYLVSKGQAGVHLMDVDATILPYDIVSIQKSKGNVTLANTASGNMLFIEDRLVEEFNSSSKLFDNNYYSIKEKRNYHIYDENSAEIGNIQLKPAEIMGEKLILAKDGSRVGLMNVYGDTLIEFASQEIVEVGNLILVKRAGNEKILNKQGNVIHALKSDETAFINSVNSNYIVADGKKGVYFNEFGERQSKLKNYPVDKILGYYADVIYTPSSLIINDSIISISKQTDFEIFENGYFAITRGETIDVYKGSISNHVFNASAKNIKYLGSGVFTYSNRVGRVFQTDEKQITLSRAVSIAEKVNDGFFVVDIRGQKAFYNLDLENPFNRQFLDVHNFQGDYATVKLAQGWTILDRNGIQKSYPSFNEIIPCGNNLFQARKKTLYGVFDRNGNNILPPIYERVEFLGDGIIQVIRNGELGYYSMDGTPIFDLLGKVD